MATEIEKILEALPNQGDTDKVILAAYQFKGDAEQNFQANPKCY